MNAFLLRLLLSAALIFQGNAAACAGISMAADMAAPATMAADSDLQHADADGCSDCPGCPDGHQAATDCASDCGMIGALPALPVQAQVIVPVDALVYRPKPSLVDFLQVPPTPPPIA